MCLGTSLSQHPLLFHNLSKACKPIAIKSRHFNSNDQMFINKEIDCLYSEGIVKPSMPPWCAQIIVVKDANNNKCHMCVDYSQTVNLFTKLDAYPLPRIETSINDFAKYHVFSTFDLHNAYHQIQITEKDRPFIAFEACGKL